MKLFFICLLLTVSMGINAQVCRCENNKYLKVTAKSGLTLREKPNRTAAKIMTIAFDTPLPVCFNYPQSQDDEWVEIEGLRGIWLKTRYKGKVGYVFSAFLNNSHTDTNFPHFNLPMYDLSEWVSLGEWHKEPILGLFQLDDYQFVAKKMTTKDTTIVSGYTYKSRRFKEKAYMTLAKQFIKEGDIIQGQEVSKYLLPDSLVTYRLGNTEYRMTATGKRTKDGIKNYGMKVTALQNGKVVKTQTYFKGDVGQYNGYYFGNIVVQWCGDLDKDGKLDMVVAVGGDEKGGVTVLLLLSSEAEEGHFFQEVTQFDASPC